MLLDRLKNTINTVIKDIEPNDMRVTVGCLLYSYLINQPSDLDVREKALSFKEYYYSEAYDRKYVNRTIGFSEISKLVENRKLKNISNIDIKDYEKILHHYSNVELERSYNPNLFGANVFGLSSFKSSAEKDAFKKLNDEYLKPISEYCLGKYESEYSNLKIIKVSDTILPAREIFFYYVDIPSTVIIDDIQKKKILFEKTPSVVRLTKESYIQLIV